MHRTPREADLGDHVRPPTRIAVTAAALAVLTAACGAGPGGEVSGEAPPAAVASDAPSEVPSSAAPAATATPSEGAPPPAAAVEALDFAAPALGGGEVRGATFAGRDVALWMWAPW